MLLRPWPGLEQQQVWQVHLQVASSPMMLLMMRRYSDVSATPVMGPLTSGSLIRLRKGDRYSSGAIPDQSAAAGAKRVTRAAAPSPARAFLLLRQKQTCRVVGAGVRMCH